MAYRLQYSDYPGTAEGPPDPDRWVGPPGPMGPAGPTGPEGDPGLGIVPPSSSPPLSATPGTLWWNATDGNTYVWYDDGTSAQWVPAMFSGGVPLYPGGGPYLPLAGGTVSGSLTAATFNVTTPTGPNIRSGAGAATGTQPKGSIWMRTDGAVGSTMYVSQGGGTWNAVSGV